MWTNCWKNRWTFGRGVYVVEGWMEKQMDRWAMCGGIGEKFDD